MGWADSGGWGGKGRTAAFPSSPSPHVLSLLPGAFHPLPRELRQPDSGVELREGAALAAGPGVHPS